MIKVYAITLVDGTTKYDLTFEDAMNLYVEGSRIWESENDGLSYFEIFVP